MRKQIWSRYSTVLRRVMAVGLLLGCVPAKLIVAQMGTSVSVPLVLPGQMSAADASLAAGSQDAIARSAQLYGYALDSTYSYREIACPYVAQYLVLAYEGARQDGPVSRFTAVVAREGDRIAPGAVQIIPILHSGVVPFVPAFSSPHSIEIFNRIVEGAPAGGAAVAALNSGEEPVLVRSLCYAAMVGEEPNALARPSLERATFQAPAPGLRFLNKGLMQQTFSIRNTAATFQVWTLTFSSSGGLVGAQREEHKIDATPVILNAGTSAAPTTISPGQGSISAPGSASVAVPAAAVVASPPTQAASVSTSSAPAPRPQVPAVATLPTSLPPAVVPTAPQVASPTEPSASIVAPMPVAAAAMAPPSEEVSPSAKFVAQPARTLPPLPQPPRRLTSGAPMAPSRFIPDSSLKMPPQAPAK